MNNPYKIKPYIIRHWTPEEDKLLVEAYLSGYSYAKMMRLLDRRFGGVKARIQLLKAVGVIKRVSN
jgi:hypothetical protein